MYAGNSSAERTESGGYMWPKVGSKRALSKTRSMTAIMSVRHVISSSRNWAESFSNFSGVNLLSKPFVVRSSFSKASTSSFVFVFKAKRGA